MSNGEQKGGFRNIDRKMVQSETNVKRIHSLRCKILSTFDSFFDSYSLRLNRLNPSYHFLVSLSSASKSFIKAKLFFFFFFFIIINSIGTKIHIVYSNSELYTKRATKMMMRTTTTPMATTTMANQRHNNNFQYR